MAALRRPTNCTTGAITIILITCLQDFTTQVQSHSTSICLHDPALSTPTCRSNCAPMLVRATQDNATPHVQLHCSAAHVVPMGSRSTACRHTLNTAHRTEPPSSNTHRAPGHARDASSSPCLERIRRRHRVSRKRLLGGSAHDRRRGRGEGRSLGASGALQSSGRDGLDVAVGVVRGDGVVKVAGVAALELLVQGQQVVGLVAVGFRRRGAGFRH